jgi:hypothetical protein
MQNSLASGAYEVLRSRLLQSANELRARFEKLHKARAEVFGNIETKLLSTVHVVTKHNCIPQDLFVHGDKVLLGANVQFGFKSEIVPEDVLSIHQFDGEHMHSASLDILASPEFLRDFTELYKYYKNATFQRFFATHTHFYMVFQVGRNVSNIKAFKWGIDASGFRYIDNRSEADIKLPAQHAFSWQRSTRENHRHGKHPHISIQDKLFVECIHGDLTVKVEDNTEDGLGIYREPVENVDQTLDDAETFYAVVNQLILLRIRPYLEKEYRHLLFNHKLSSVTRLDAIGSACVFLPDDHGIIFSNGYALQTGQTRLFDHGLTGLSFDQLIKAPNGEDFLFLFYQSSTGSFLQLQYNLIRQDVETPRVCNGQGFCDDGRMLTLRASNSPQKHHNLQLWQTPFASPNFTPKVDTSSFLFKIGNQELVRGMAACAELLTLIDRDEAYADLYADLEKMATNVLDGFFWLDREEVCKLAEPVQAIREAARAAVDEFDKVTRVRQETEKAITEFEQQSKELIATIDRSRLEKIDDFVNQLASIRKMRGRAVSIRELRYSDEERIASTESSLIQTGERLGGHCVQFLLNPSSLNPYREQTAEIEKQIPTVKGSAQGKNLDSSLIAIGEALELLMEMVSQLRIDDLAQRTKIVDSIADCLSGLNRSRTQLRTRLRETVERELEADFASQSKLLDNATSSALETADTPDRVDSALGRLLLQIEEIEAKYADSESLLVRLAEIRQGVCDAFENKRQQLVATRTKRADGLVAAAERILSGISSRSLRILDPQELQSYFASDLMVEKVRGIAQQLLELGDTVRRDDTLSKLRTIADDAVRQQQDKRDLLSGNGKLIKLGTHTFSINDQPVELTTVARNGQLWIHITGTDFFEQLSGPELEANRDLWDQQLPSESNDVYRGEYLAYLIVKNFEYDVNEKERWRKFTNEERIEWVRAQMQPRYQDGYSRGVHDRDVVAIVNAILDLTAPLGLLLYSPKIRAKNWFVWEFLISSEVKSQICNLIRTETIMDGSLVNRVNSKDSLASSSALKPSLSINVSDILKLELRQHSVWGGESEIEEGCHYLWKQLRELISKSGGLEEPLHFPQFSLQAVQLWEAFRKELPPESHNELIASISRSIETPVQAWRIASIAVDKFLGHDGTPAGERNDPTSDYREELALLIILNACHSDAMQSPVAQPLDIAIDVHGLVGDHVRIQNGVLEIHIHEFQQRLKNFHSNIAPRWFELHNAKQRQLQIASTRLKVHDLKARVLTSFVRNQLIDEVYLPRIGDNLAKQIGTADENKRTDRMGLLLLISPPGYGKTTLMEYVASRLGLVLVKVNGPALGHEVTSLDPSAAPNAAARDEVLRINLALEMRDNTLLYIDDIQHCNVELLQKFIPLCDATRRIEGVWEGKSKSYDFRGRKFAVVMAGNPYTESGQRFQIPDMLANRADVYNLGEIIGGNVGAFEQSYLENCLTSNTSLLPLARASNKDQRKLIAAAAFENLEPLELESNLSSDSTREMHQVLRKLLRVRDIVLKVNREYIRSAAQSDDYRTEPPFKLQGSYRNMNRIAEKVVSVMNESELMQTIVSSFEQDAQTLSKDGESNLLKFKELLGSLTSEEAERWLAIKCTFVEKNRLKGLSDQDSSAQFLVSLLSLKDGLDSIHKSLDSLGNTHRENLESSRLKEQAVARESSKTSEEKRGADSMAESKIIVQHAVPRVIADLIRGQYQLLFDGLKPVIESLTQQSASNERLRSSMKDVLELYDKLLHAAEKTKNESDIG